MIFKVLTIYYKHRRGGFCKRFRLKIEAYLKTGWQVHYIAVEPYPYQDKNLIPHILPCPFQKHYGIFFWAWFFSMAPLYALLLGLRNKFQLISAATPVYAWISGPVKWLRKAPMITLLFTKPQFTTDCHDDYRSLKNFENIMERWGVHWSDKLIANSFACRKSWIQRYHLNPDKVEVHTNHIDAPLFKKEEQRQKLIQEFDLPQDSFVITSTGILEPHKNLDFLISAFSRIRSTRAVLMLIGGGEQLPHLEKVAEDMGVTNQVIFTGWHDNAREMVQGSDLFVFPSLWEGMSESLLEATTCKVPCLVSNIPENTEVIRNPEQHFNPDKQDELILKLDRCIEEPGYYEELLIQTETDGDRFKFDWENEFIEKIRKFMADTI